MDALYLALRLVKVDVSYMDLVEKAGLRQPQQEIGLDTLLMLARTAGVDGSAIEVQGRDSSDLLGILRAEYRRVAILHLRNPKLADHFVCAYVAKGGTLRLASEVYENIPDADWKSRWSGAALILSAGSPPSPKLTSHPSRGLSADPKTFDAGDVPFDGSFSYRVEIRNDGNETRSIRRVLPSCQFATANLSAQEVPPKEAITISGSVSVGQSIGPAKATLAIATTNPSDPVTTVVLKWNVEPPPVRLVPSTVYLDVLQGQKADATIAAVSRNDGSRQLSRVVASAPWLQCRLSQDRKAISLTATPDWAEGAAKTVVLVYPAVGKEPLRLLVEAHVKPVIAATPNWLFFRTSPGRHVPRREIQVSSVGQPWQIRKIELVGVDGNVVLRSDPEMTGKLHLDLLLCPCEGPGTFIGSVGIETDHSLRPRISIPVYVFCE